MAWSVVGAYRSTWSPFLRMHGDTSLLVDICQRRRAGEPGRSDSSLDLDARDGPPTFARPGLDHDITSVIEANSYDLRHLAGAEQKGVDSGVEVCPTPTVKPFGWSGEGGHPGTVSPQGPVRQGHEPVLPLCGSRILR